MAKRISQLDELTSLDGGEDIPIVKGGQNYRVKSSLVRSAATKESLGLGNVDNTSDANKPISNATQSALNGKANSVHTHTVAQVDGLTEALAAKANASHGHTATEIAGLQQLLDGKAAAQHSHDASSINGLDEALASKSDVGHTHTKDQISGLNNDLANLQGQINQKAGIIHAHGVGEISGLGAAIDQAVTEAVAGIQVDASQISNLQQTVDSSVASAVQNIEINANQVSGFADAAVAALQSMGYPGLTAESLPGFDEKVVELIAANGGGQQSVVAGQLEW